MFEQVHLLLFLSNMRRFCARWQLVASPVVLPLDEPKATLSNIGIRGLQQTSSAQTSSQRHWHYSVVFELESEA